MRITFRILRTCAFAAALAFGQAQGSGFQVRANSVKNLGRANAGTAVARDDASVVLNNPAAMTGLGRITVQTDLVVSDLTESFAGAGTATITGDAITGGDGGDRGTTRRIPTLAAVFPLDGALDKFTLGASLSAPFGFRTAYDADWVGRYQAIDSQLSTVDLTLSAAWAPTERLSLGVGLIGQRADMRLSNAIDFGSFICGIADRRFCDPSYGSWTPQGQDGGVVVRAHDGSFGWVAGVLWRPADRLWIGLSHRSRIEHRLRGHADFTLPDDVARWYDGLGPGVDDPPVLVALTTPSVTTLSMRWDVGDRHRLMADIQQTGWSAMRPLMVSSTQSLGLLHLDVFGYLGPLETVGWKDTRYYALGGEWDLQERLTLRAGIAADQTPTNDRTRTPRLPDNKATVYSFGLSWRATPELSVDAAYQRIDFDNARIDTPLIAPYWFSQLRGDFNGHVDLIGIAAQYRF